MNLDVLQTTFIISILLLLFTVPSLLKWSNASDDPNLYYKSAIVTEKKGNVAYLEDTTGNIWTVENEDVQLYGRYILTMSDNNTDTIYDDEIIKIE